MKYAIIIPDGAADQPLPQLGGQTPLQAAYTPNMDSIAATGEQGLVRTVPDGFESGSDVAIMTLLGYDPAVYHTGRAPLEAAALKIPISPNDWVFRCNLVTVIDDIMRDHSAGGISDADARELLETLRGGFNTVPLELHFGVSYRNLLVYRGSEKFDLKTKPPHEIPGEKIDSYLPSGPGSETLNSLMMLSRKHFAGHAVTQRRLDVNPATQIWIWGQGHPPDMPKFAERFGVGRGCMITGVDLLRGLANLLGWHVQEVPGMTSFHDTDYAGQGRATCDMLDQYDLVVSHVEAPDEASHQADFKTKVESIEAIDREVVAPVLKKLKTFRDWRLLVMPDHPTNIATRKHGYDWPPFAIAGSDILSGSGKSWSEINATAAGLRFPEGHELMRHFLDPSTDSAAASAR